MSQGALKAVIDTSALYLLLKRLGESASPLLRRLAILDPTNYEVEIHCGKSTREDSWKNGRKPRTNSQRSCSPSIKEGLTGAKIA